MSYSDGAVDREGRIAALLEAAVLVTGEHELETVLRRIVDGAAGVTQARYAALAVFNPTGCVTSFIHVGIDDATVAAIGRLPTGQGLLGATVTAAGPVRVNDIASDPRSAGFPPGHPHMTSYLGAPIGRGGRHFGNLYLTDSTRPGGFGGDDEALVMSLAAFAACAIESAELLALERQRAEAVASQTQIEERARSRSELLAATIAAQEAERARVARDLHDDIGQALTSVLLWLRLVEDGDIDTSSAAQSMPGLAELRELVADALQRTRRLAFDLRPTVLDDVGLAPALARLADDLSQHGAALVIDTVVDDSAERVALPTELATVVYRVVQEALTNVARHANAASATVTITVHAGVLRAVVEDDGVGFDPTASTACLGLRGMNERAQLVGGSLRVVSTPGSGTMVILEVPVE
ncbi:MAG: GAF domain-containing sensor histidine kinase [Actinobacteria bacterium]|nr:GAF domain-containing sensor histidine kinase [Actinomycetota bacterium]